MKTKEQKQVEAKIRQAEHNKLTPKQKLIKLNLQVGDSGASIQRSKLLHEVEHFAAIPEGVGDSTNKKEKKPYQKLKKS
jgi:hypothetical protein